MPQRPTRLALYALALSLVVSALIGITVILLGDFDETEMKVLATAGMVAGFSILSLPSLFHWERSRYKYFTRVGVFASLLFFAMVLFVIWGGGLMAGEGFGKTLGTFGVVAFASNHALLILIARPSRVFIRLCQWGTIAVIGIVGTILLGAIWTGELAEPIMRILGTFAVLDALGTVAVPILVRISRSS